MRRPLQTVTGVAKAAPLSESGWDERLLIHICYSPRRYLSDLNSNIVSRPNRALLMLLKVIAGSLTSLFA